MALGACAGPALRPLTPVGTGPVIQEAAGLWVSVEAEAWRGRPRTLPDFVLPFLVLLRNTGTARVSVTREDFLLLDDANRQYFTLAPAEVVTLLGGRVSGVGISPSLEVSGSTAGWTVFGVGLGIFFGGSGSETRDIIPLALAEGSFLPGAELTGFLYFPRPTRGYKSLHLVGILPDLPGEPRLDFEFRRVNP